MSSNHDQVRVPGASAQPAAPVVPPLELGRRGGGRGGRGWGGRGTGRLEDEGSEAPGPPGPGVSSPEVTQPVAPLTSSCGLNGAIGAV